MPLNHRRKTIWLCFQLFAMLFWGESCVQAPEPAFHPARVVHNIDSLNHVELLWSKNDVYIKPNGSKPTMSVSSELVCLLGDVASPPMRNVISCIRPISQEIVWQKSTDAPSGIIVVNQEVLVSYYGAKGVEKYNAEGDVIWSRYLITGITFINLYENQVQLFILPERFLVLDFTDGSTIEDTKDVDVFFSTPKEKFLMNMNLESRSVDLKRLNWSVEIWNKDLRLAPAPLITEDFVFFRTGETIGSIFAVNRTTGQVLWQTPTHNIISNLVYLAFKEQLIALTHDGKLVAIDVQNGKQTTLVKFSTTPFILSGEEMVGYELAYDEKSKSLYLFLGDSRQLFAFRID